MSMNSQDHADLAKDAYNARQMTGALDKPVPIETPLMALTKAETWALAEQLGADSGLPGGGQALVDLIVEHSHTCYLGDRTHRHAWGYGCGTCPACELRARGWVGYSDQA